MPTENPFREAAAAAREKTNQELGSDLARLTTLPEAEIARMFPRKADREKLAKLVAIVKSSTARNRKLADFRKNLSDLGDVAIRLLEHFL